MHQKESFSLFSSERDRIILDYLEQNNHISVIEVSKICNVSNSTARIQLKKMDQEGLLIRVHGGAIRKDDESPRIDSESIEKVNNYKQKIRIAMAAKNTVQSGDVLAIGGGSTCEVFANALLDIDNICVYTNSIRIASILMKNRSIDVTISGGPVQFVHQVCIGNRPEEFFSKVRLAKSYVGTDSIDGVSGLTSTNPDERSERAMFSSGEYRYVLCDSSKIGLGPYGEQIAPIKDVDCIIIDSDISEEQLKELETLDTKIIIA